MKERRRPGAKLKTPSRSSVWNCGLAAAAELKRWMTAITPVLTVPVTPRPLKRTISDGIHPVPA
jgi:hypothetical protein